MPVKIGGSVVRTGRMERRNAWGLDCEAFQPFASSGGAFCSGRHRLTIYVSMIDWHTEWQDAPLIFTAAAIMAAVRTDVRLDFCQVTADGEGVVQNGVSSGKADVLAETETQMFMFPAGGVAAEKIRYTVFGSK